MTIERGIKRAVVILSALTFMGLLGSPIVQDPTFVHRVDAMLFVFWVGLSVAVASLWWVAFYIIRWIVRGFREPKR